MYTIQRDYYVAEFNYELYEGDVLYDGDLEPDLIANLLVYGVIVSDAVPMVEVDLELEDAEDA